MCCSVRQLYSFFHNRRARKVRRWCTAAKGFQEIKSKAIISYPFYRYRLFMCRSKELMVREERDKLEVACQALEAYHNRVSCSHFPEVIRPCAADDETGNPLHWVMRCPPVTPPPPPLPPLPPTTPLPHCSYEREWLDFASDRSQREYQRLFHMYGIHLGRGEEGLVHLWRALGGVKYWRTKLRHTQLALLLSREEKSSTLKFRAWPDELLAFGGDMMSDKKEEIVAFCSQLLSRLPALHHLTIIDSPVWPFDYKVLDAVSFAFPKLEYVHLPLVASTGREVAGLVQRIPTLAKGDGVWIDASRFKRGNDMTEVKFRRITRGRVSIAPPKKWEPIINGLNIDK